MYVYNLCNLCNLCNVCRVCRVCSVCIACRYVVTQCNAMCRVVLCYIVSLLSSTCNSYICPCPLLRVFEACCPGLLSFTCLAWPARQLEDEVLIGLLGAKIAAWSHWSTSEDFRPWSLFSKLLKASRFYLWLFVLMYNTRNMDLNSETWQMCSCKASATHFDFCFSYIQYCSKRHLFAVLLKRCTGTFRIPLSYRRIALRSHSHSLEQQGSESRPVPVVLFWT